MLRALSHVSANPNATVVGLWVERKIETRMELLQAHHPVILPLSTLPSPPALCLLFSFFLFLFFLFAKEKECEKVGRAEKVTNNYINRQGGSPQKDGDEDIKQEPRNQNQHRRPERLKASLTPHIHTSGHTHPRSPQAQLGWKKNKQHNVTSSYQKGSQ
jgi:hypothetical protein